MAWQLTEEVYAHAPAGLTLSERAVLLVIAEEARADTRGCPLARAELVRRAGLSVDGVRAALRRLRDRGLEVRVPLEGRVDRVGNPVFAVPGLVSRYRLPVFAPAVSGDVVTEPAGAVDNPNVRGVRDASLESEGGYDVPGKGGTTYPGRGVRDTPRLRSTRSSVTTGGTREQLDDRPVDNPPSPPAPDPTQTATIPGLLVAVPAGVPDEPPRCARCSRLPPDVDQDCRTCGRLRKRWLRDRAALDDARRQALTDEAEQRAAAAAAGDDCAWCDEHRWRLAYPGGPPVEPALRCDHEPDATCHDLRKVSV